MKTEKRDGVSAVRCAILAAVFSATAALGLGIEGPENVAAGPDVTVIYLGSTTNWGASGGTRAYSVGTTSCNIGGAPVAWCDSASCVNGTLERNDHPVIAQNVYRLKDGSFQQIGMSWLKHGWLSTNSFDGACGSCQIPPGGGDQLGVGCTDTYGSGLNGGSGNPGTCDGASGQGCRLGQRSAVNGTSGDFPMPYHDVTHPLVIDQRIQIAESDVDPAQNTGALYWVEGQYIAADDALAGNAFNNASYRAVVVGASPFNLTLQGATIREKSAIHAWKAADAAVELFNVEFCAAPVERFELGRRVTQVDGDTWHYEYALRNMNSDHAAGAFSVQFPPGTTIENVAFHDVDSHSGEPYSTTDWTPTIDSPAGSVRWATETYASNADANALRFATMYTFSFDAAAPAGSSSHEVELFKPFPELVIDAGADVGICAGDSVLIGTPAVPGQTYSWDPGGQTTAQIQVSPETTTVYTLTTSDRCHSSEDSVTVTVAPAPASPALTSPADGAVLATTSVALEWSAVPGAVAYQVEVATDPAFAIVVVNEETADPALALPPLSSGTYYWRVRANDGCWGAAASAFSFTIDSDIFSDGFESGTTDAWTVPPVP